MFWVEYLCLRLSPYWQSAGGPLPIQIAIRRAQIVKPLRGRARVLNQAGEVVYSL